MTEVQGLLESAATKHRTGDVEGAIRACGRVLDLDPRNADAHCRVAMCAEELGDIEVAELHFRHACAPLAAAAVDRFGALDILVCNAGSGASVAPGEETPEEWKRMLKLNLMGATNMVAAARDALARANGAVVCVSSITGLEVLGAPIAYSAAKAALNAFVRGIARPLAQEGVRINAVAPDNILFPGSAWAHRLERDGAGVRSTLAREVAMGRLGQAEEIADVVAFLASPRASFMTGSIVVVDGGQTRS